MSEQERAAAASADAKQVVSDFIEKHRAAAIPALIAHCVAWAVENGGADVVKGSLTRALALIDDLATELRATMS